MSHHKPFHKHFVSDRKQRGKYLIPSLSWAAPSIFTPWPTEHSSQRQAASQGYLHHGSWLTNLLANTCSKPEESLKRQWRSGGGERKPTKKKKQTKTTNFLQIKPKRRESEPKHSTICSCFPLMKCWDTTLWPPNAHIYVYLILIPFPAPFR